MVVITKNTFGNKDILVEANQTFRILPKKIKKAL